MPLVFGSKQNIETLYYVPGCLKSAMQCETPRKNTVHFRLCRWEGHRRIIKYLATNLLLSCIGNKKSADSSV